MPGWRYGWFYNHSEVFEVAIKFKDGFFPKNNRAKSFKLNERKRIDIIKITLDDELKNALNENFEARKLGQAEFIRQALLFYLRVTEQARIRQEYRKGYGGADLTELALEMQDWEDEQVWPKS